MGILQTFRLPNVPPGLKRLANSDLLGNKNGDDIPNNDCVSNLIFPFSLPLYHDFAKNKYKVLRKHKCHQADIDVAYVFFLQLIRINLNNTNQLANECNMQARC